PVLQGAAACPTLADAAPAATRDRGGTGERPLAHRTRALEPVDHEDTPRRAADTAAVSTGRTHRGPGGSLAGGRDRLRRAVRLRALHPGGLPARALERPVRHPGTPQHRPGERRPAGVRHPGAADARTAAADRRRAVGPPVPAWSCRAAPAAAFAGRPDPGDPGPDGSVAALPATRRREPAEPAR